MNLNPNYRYVIIDTETTGLSIEEDEIIQIGLITFDHEWNITNRFCHYVKPDGFDEDKLKPLIQHITGIDPAQIMSASPLSTIWPQIQQYFGDNTIIIGHNISFDLAILGKHHALEYADTIDTYDVSRAMLHYQRSYSLEILHQHLMSQPRYTSYLKGITIQAHDALSDCYMTYGVLRYGMERVGDLVSEYDGLESILPDGQWSKYLTPDPSPAERGATIVQGKNQSSSTDSSHNSQGKLPLLKTITWEDFGFEPYEGKISKHEQKSKGVLIDQNGNVLVMRVKAAANNGIDFYDLPGGTLEEGENNEQGLIREVKEETGYALKNIKHIADIAVQYNNIVGYNLHGYLCYTDGLVYDTKLTESEIQQGYELITVTLDSAIDNINRYLDQKAVDKLRGAYMNSYAYLQILKIAQACLSENNINATLQDSSLLSEGHNSQKANQVVGLPTLKAPLASPKTMVDHEYYDWTGLASTSKIGLEHAGFRESLLRLVHPSRKMIIAFAHRAKLDLAKKILADHGISGLGYMRPNQYIDPSQLTSLGTQGLWDEDEVSWMLKYCSHHMQGLSVLDHNTPGDFKIFARVRLIRDDADADIILSTHAGVYAALQDHTHSDHAILFWDHQWWLSSAQRYFSNGVRIDHMLNMIQGVIYKLRHSDDEIDLTSRESTKALSPGGETWLGELESWREVTRGVFGAEITEHMSKFPTNNRGNIELLGGIDRAMMHRFASLYTRGSQYFARMYEMMPQDDAIRIQRILTRLDTMLHEGCQIELQSSYQGDNIIISPANTYVDYADFRALFTDHHVIFTNTSGEGIDNITTPLHPHTTVTQIAHISKLDYQSGQKLYIIQSNRNQCRNTFNTLMKSGLNTQTLLMGENVTGGGKKLIEQARGKPSYVMVGGYDLYMQTLAAQIPFDAVIIIGTLGVMHDQMLRDIEFYGS